MDIDQRPAGKSGEAFKTIDQPGRFAADKRQYAERMGSLGQLARQMLQHAGGQGMAAAHWVLSVTVEHPPDGLGMHRVGVAGLQYKNFCGIHFHPRSHKVLPVRNWQRTATLS
ncbi:hypothetical protein D3C86_1571040 [compost metagenome]